MKRKLSLAQGLVEYALLLTMVTVPMIVIYATLGDAAGEVWQSVVDGLSDTNMFEVHEYTLGATNTPTATKITETTLESPSETSTITNTVDPFAPPTETPTATEIPPTETHFVPATYTFTASPVTPTDVPPTEIPTDTATPVPTPTPVYIEILSISSDWVDSDYIQIGINVNVESSKLKIVNVNTGARTNIECSWYCSVRYFDSTHAGGYAIIKSKTGDEINYYYPSRSW